jgi:PHP family Zn ribbon phosphoesterase
MAIEALRFADKSPRTVKLTEDIVITLDEEAYEIGYTHGQMADRPKGEWIKKQVFNPELDKYVPLIECSVCGYEPYFGGSESKFNYCANCGAKMIKGGDSE